MKRSTRIYRNSPRLEHGLHGNVFLTEVDDETVLRDARKSIPDELMVYVKVVNIEGNKFWRYTPEHRNYRARTFPERERTRNKN
jgi:hypothetical protein